MSDFIPIREQQFFNQPSGITKLRYASVCLSTASDFIKHDMRKLSEGTNEEKEKVMKHIEQKLDYIDYLAGEFEGNIRQVFPQEADSTYLLNRFVTLPEIPLDFNMVSRPPRPCVCDDDIYEISKNFSNIFTQAKSRMIKKMDIADEIVKEMATLRLVEEADIIYESDKEDGSDSNSDTEDYDPRIDDLFKMNPEEIMELYLETADKHATNSSLLSGTEFICQLVLLKVVPFSSPTFYRHLKRYKKMKEKGESTDKFTWTRGRTGTKPLIDLNLINEVLKPGDNGESLNSKAIGKILTGMKKKRALESGKDPDLVKDVCVKTCKRYKCIGACSSSTKIRKQVRHKNLCRYIGERSILSTATYLHTIAQSHYVISHEKPEYMKYLPPIEEASEGAQKLYKLVEKCNPGMHVSPINPSLVVSTDDSTVYALKGEVQEKQEWVLVDNNNEDTKKDSTYASFSMQGDTLCLKGRRVRITTTIAANGMTAPIFVTVYGMNERDLPKREYPDGVHVEKFDGLCMGGGQDVHTQGHGYVCFVRGGEKNDSNSDISPDTAAFQKYREIVLKPFLRKLKQIVFKGEEYSIDEIHEDIDNNHVCVSWCDGGGPQVQAMMKNTEVANCNVEKIIANKHSRSRSAVEQPCDIAPCFLIIKKISKYLSAEDTPFNPLIASFTEKFETLDKDCGIYLGTKKAHIVDFLACLPSIMSKAMTPHNVSIGFLGSGMIDKKTKVYPDYNSIMNTCKNSEITSTRIQKLFIDNFEVMYEEQLKKGMLSDEFLLDLGFPVDRYPNGEEYIYEPSDKNEGCHRSKQFTHKYWVKKREDVIRQARQKKIEDNEKLAQKTTDLHKDNKRAEQILKGFLGPDVTSFENATQQQLFKVPNHCLYAFTYARIYGEFSASNKIKKPNKGDLTHILSGGDSCVNLAFAVKDKKVCLETSLECRLRLSRLV